MRCPKCGGGTTVLSVKVFDDNLKISKLRKRACEKCGYKFYTKEMPSKQAELHFRVADSDRHKRGKE